MFVIRASFAVELQPVPRQSSSRTLAVCCQAGRQAGTLAAAMGCLSVRTAGQALPGSWLSGWLAGNTCVLCPIVAVCHNLMLHGPEEVSPMPISKALIVKCLKIDLVGLPVSRDLPRLFTDAQLRALLTVLRAISAVRHACKGTSQALLDPNRPICCSVTQPCRCSRLGVLVCGLDHVVVCWQPEICC